MNRPTTKMWFIYGLVLLILGSFTTIVLVGIGTAIMGASMVVEVNRRLKFYDGFNKGRRS